MTSLFFRSVLRFWMIGSMLCAGALPAPAASLPRDTIVYGVIPPLFGSDHPLQSVTGRLDNLKALGVSVLWLSPITTSDDPSQISYAVTDYRGLREDFGSPDDLRNLVREAHVRAMKVIVDFVPNHSSSKHPWFLDSIKRGKDSPYYDYYLRDAKGKPQHYFDWENLPNLNYSNPEVVREISDAMVYWLKEYDLDGFRMDAAWGLRERTPDLWPSLLKKLAEVKPGLIFVAEAGARDEYYLKNGFDAAYDWTDQLGEWAWEKAFQNPKSTGQSLMSALAATTHGDAVLRFLNNNDTGKRFVTRYGLGKTRIAAVFQFTVPGIPLLYTGDEVAATYEPYEDPQPLSWKGPEGWRSFYLKLTKLRKLLPALTSADLTPLKTNGNPATCAYLRGSADGTDWAVVVLNFGKKTSLELTLPEKIQTAVSSGKLWDTLNDRDVTMGDVPRSGTLKLDIPAESALILITAKK